MAKSPDILQTLLALTWMYIALFTTMACIFFLHVTSFEQFIYVKNLFLQQQQKINKNKKIKSITFEMYIYSHVHEW